MTALPTLLSATIRTSKRGQVLFVLDIGLAAFANVTVSEPGDQ